MSTVNNMNNPLRTNPIALNIAIQRVIIHVFNSGLGLPLVLPLGNLEAYSKTGNVVLLFFIIFFSASK